MTTRDYPRIVVSPPGPKGKAIVAKDAEYASTSYIKVYPLVVSHGRGAMVEDVDGNRFLDFMAGIAVAATGHAHPEVVSAVTEVAGRFFSMCSTDFYYPEMSNLCERLANLGPGPEKKRVFLTNSGTEAVEGTIKLVRNSRRRSDLIAFRGAFHGRSMGALSLSSSKVEQRATFGPWLPGVHHVPYPDPYRADVNSDEVGVGYIRNELFTSHVSPDDVAAIFVEPMLGEGGYIIPPREFLVGLRELCDETGILLVFDEIQTGAGRTGHLWAADYYGVAPDVLVTAKGLGSGLPIGAIIARESIMKWAPGSHGSTFGGSPLGCAAALATLDLLEAGIMDNARAMGSRLLAGARELKEKYDVIGDVRGVGLFIGVELVEDRATKKPAHDSCEALMKLAFERGLLLLSCGESVIRLAPPLVVDEYDIDTGLAILDDCLRTLCADRAR